jgi:heat shock protein HslJ/C-terminal processing protease CtpA/Prc
MKKVTLLLLLSFIVGLLAACGGEAQPTATPAPVVEPTVAVAPTVEPTTESETRSTAAETGDLDALTANTWQWVSFTDPLQQFEVEMPENYLLTFNEDGTVNIKADCNQASGSYTDDAGSLTIEVGPMTMAACPPESRSDEFVQNLGFAVRYFFEGDTLYIDLMADGGTMAFAPADAELMADDGEGAMAGAAESAGDVTSYPWLWSSFTSPVEQFDLEDPENYVITFNDDGTVNIKADCNNASGSYTIDAGSLAIEIGPMTMAACPPDSRSDQFVTLLGSAARYFFEDAQLYIDLMADGGTMVFAPEGEAELAEAAASGTGNPTAIAVEDLRNATYSGIYDEPVTLTHGMYEEDPFTVQYIEDAELYGDLDGDGVQDAVVFLLERGGGTGAFIYIAAQLNEAGQPVDAGAVWMDEVSVRSAAIEDGQVVVELIVIGPGDADCCGSHKATRTYALQEGQLAEVSGEEEDLEQVSAADLDGTEWILLELDYDEPVAADAEVTIGFQDGQIAGSGGCNNYTGSFSLGEENPLTMTIGPVAATKMACPEPILGQETAYFAALESVSGWDYYFGRLALYYYVEDQAGLSRLLFAPANEAESAGDLTSYPWLWRSFTSPVEQFDVEPPESYVLTFNDDGTVNIKADCNNAQGSYTVDAGSLTVEVGPMTMAACPPKSRSDQFVQYLGFAASYFFEDAELYIDLMADGGTLVFAPEGEAELAAAAEAAQSAAGSGLRPADVANDEGGPVLVSGEFNWTSSYIPRHFKEPVAVLMDVSSSVIGDYSEYVPSDGQIMGVLTRPLAPAPTAYEVELPIRPDGQLVDLDNDGEDDTGVQVYAAVFSSNLVGDSYLEQVEQEGFKSILTDPLTGRIREGTLLVYAPDDQQGFPSGAGPDGVYFSADDPAVALPAGFTLATLSLEGQVSFDRSEVATMAILEPASQASPDFSDQGFVESFSSLIDLLKVRYSYTELRGLDWEAIREEYLPRMEEAEQEEDSAAYFSALNDMALSVRDAHVNVGTLDFLASANYIVQATEPYQGTFGVQIAELSDGRFVVTYLDPEGPGAEAGWQVGTEILSVDGVPLAERIETIPLVDSAGNPEAIRLEQLRYVLGFPMDSQVAVEYLQPGEDQPRSATLAASYEGAPQVPQPQFDFEEEISFKALENGSYYIQWDMFLDDAYKIAVWQKFLDEAHEAPGIIIDLRRNGGGGTALMYTMLSYLFSADDPVLMHWIDDYVYDDQSGDLVLEFATDYKLRSPDPDLTYSGLVAVLVSELPRSKLRGIGSLVPQR